MSSTVIKETTSVKLDKAAKDEAKRIFGELGLTMGEAFNLFLHQVTLNKGLPFEVKIPDKLTKSIIDEAQKTQTVPKRLE
ncbi:MAG TPA: type II toxin-antitoxin system RelB/DinJ family antitoxin [Aeromonadales bacterium]|nr:type II toxin-antitoxin system RelB/DinJ family antitoxin [Aeromonadales bacterium]